MHLIRKSDLILRVIGRGNFLVDEDFIVHDYYLRDTLDPKKGIDEDIKYRVIKVGRGYITDLATVGRSGNLILKAVNSTQAATVHDYLYSVYSGRLLITRKQADKIFREMLIQIDRVTKWRAWAAYYAVRIFSAGHYGKKK